MDVWLEWGRGPIFRFAIVFMVLGLVRLAAISVWELCRVMRRAGDKSVPYSKVAGETIRWLFPIGKLGNRLIYSLTTLALHVSVLIVPVFLIGHIDLWRRGIGISWPGIPNTLADTLTVVAVLSLLAVIIQRVAARDTRHLSRFQDYLIPFLIALPFASGFFVMHPMLNPLAYETMLLAHVLSADLILVLLPITKLSHCVLLPTTQLVSETAWHFTPHAGTEVARALGKENEAI